VYLGAFIGAFLFCLVTGIAVAQETTSIEIRSGTVLAVQGNDLIVRGPEGVKRFRISDDFRFNMEGKMLSVHELKPGMPISAVIKTTQTPVPMWETEIKKGEVVHSIGTSFVIRTEDGEMKKFTAKEIDSAGIVIRDNQGKVISPMDLRKGTQLSATVVTEAPPKIINNTELEVFVAQSPPPPPRQAVRKAPAPPPAEPKPVVLPKTGSRLPIVGLVGLIALAVGAGLTLVRRFHILG
jgi:LPXTG-motif cell wall-anchored protein